MPRRCRHSPIDQGRNDFTARYPLIVEAVEALPVRSCVMDGEAVACDGDGLSIFEKLQVTSRAVDLIWLGLALPLRMVIGKAVGRGVGMSKFHRAE